MNNLYMFAIMPPAEVAAAIEKERQLFSSKYNCFKALKPPVHITLYPPFHESAEFEDRVKPLLKWTKTQPEFLVSLLNFNFFNNHLSPVIFIDVVKNPLLSKFQKEFTSQLKKYMDDVHETKSYKPHFTIGYRDVPPTFFPAIRKDYAKRRFHAAFDVKCIYLWKHDGKNWHVISEFGLGTNTQLF